MGRTLSWLANSVLFVLCCYLVADAANEVFAALLTPTAGEVGQAAAATTEPKRSWSDRKVILSRNLFNASLLAPPAPVVAEVAEEDLEESRLPLRLLGTAASIPPELSWAAVQDETDRRTLVVRVNDPLRTAVVKRIERRRIVLLEGGERRELALDEEDTPVAKARPPGRRMARARPPKAARRAPVRPRKRARPPPRAKPQPEVVRRVAPDEFEVGRDDVDDMLRNPSNLFSQARILPKYEKGAMVGLQINAIKPGSLFEDIGIQSGDVITRLNGITIDDPQESAKILTEFSEAESFTVDVQRGDGSVDTLEFSFEE